jgi:hypothetical protein
LTSLEEEKEKVSTGLLLVSVWNCDDDGDFVEPRAGNFVGRARRSQPRPQVAFQRARNLSPPGLLSVGGSAAPPSDDPIKFRVEEVEEAKRERDFLLLPFPST